MIRYICSDCGYKFGGGTALVGFETKLVVHLMPTNNGVAVGVESTPHMKLGKVTIKQIECPKCGAEVARTPRYVVACGNCSAEIGETNKSLEATERFCRDNHLVYCNRCWKKLVSRFCEVCQYASDCTALQANRR